jgi:hypothetical protein
MQIEDASTSFTLIHLHPSHPAMHPPKTPPPPTMSVRSQSPDIPQPVVYARLHHFRGKSSAAKEGRSKQVYNVDALQVVFGREESCDIRIYADNVSRKHCMIVVDLLTGKVSFSSLCLASAAYLFTGNTSRPLESWTETQPGSPTRRNHLHPPKRRHHQRHGP